MSRIKSLVLVVGRFVYEVLNIPVVFGDMLVYGFLLYVLSEYLL